MNKRQRQARERVACIEARYDEIIQVGRLEDRRYSKNMIDVELRARRLERSFIRAHDGHVFIVTPDKTGPTDEVGPLFYLSSFILSQAPNLGRFRCDCWGRQGEYYSPSPGIYYFQPDNDPC